MTRIGAISNQPQMAFQAKKPNRKAIHEFIDNSNNLAMELMHKDRPPVQNRERAVRQAADEFKLTTIILKIMKETLVEKPIESIKNKLFKL